MFIMCKIMFFTVSFISLFIFLINKHTFRHKTVVFKSYETICFFFLISFFIYLITNFKICDWYRKWGCLTIQILLSHIFTTKMLIFKNDLGKLALDIFLRVLLLAVYGIFQLAPPFKRVIHPEEVWLYKNPMTESYCSMKALWEIVVIVPAAIIFANYIAQKNKHDVIQASLSFSLAISLNGAVTNILKVIVGRPRPDFYYRCFPNGKGNAEMKDCTGDIDIINDGLKSFPSGHSSIAFACLGFMSLYMAGKMHLFAPSGKGSTVKLLVFIFPLFIATVIAVSRTCDYHHHWQDVLCGSLLGFSICWLCYHNYYPPLNSEKCHIPLLNSGTKHLPEGDLIKEV